MTIPEDGEAPTVTDGPFTEAEDFGEEPTPELREKEDRLHGDD